MAYRWIITKDHFGTKWGDKLAVGIEGPNGCDSNLKDNPQHFSLYDDDRECFAEGMIYSTDDDHNYETALFSPLDNFGTPNWGCTAIKVDGEFV